MNPGVINAGKFPGLTLKAWAIVAQSGSFIATLIKGFNVASASSGSAGSFNITFTAAMAGTNYITDFAFDTDQYTPTIAPFGRSTGKTTTTVNISTYGNAGALAQIGFVFLAFYE